MARAASYGRMAMATGMALLGMVTSGCAMFNTGTWRYKLTLVVDDQGTFYTGSSVVEVHVNGNGFMLPEATPHARVKGEATVVDIAGKGRLFAVLGSHGGTHNADNLVFAAFRGPGGLTREGIAYYSQLKAKRYIPFELLPLLVRFKDIRDPKTIERVDPHNLAASFGPGVTLTKAILEMTDEPVTHTIAEKLPSFGDETGFAAWHRKLHYGDPRQVDLYTFIKR